jgi:hypothetical protein
MQSSGKGTSKSDQKDKLADEIVEQGSNITPDEVHRSIRRGDETKGDPNARDAAGGPNVNETPHGREEAKNDKPGAANVNG